ncbi:MAG: Hsp20/alpha crystallin family protein [Candidatus Binatia bacterium]
MSKAEENKEERQKSKGLTTRRSFPELNRMEREMERMFDNFFSPRWSPFARGRFWPARGKEVGAPAVDVDVYEEKDEIVAKAELPGMDKDEIEVDIREGLLTIKGEKKKEEETKDEHYYCAERSYGSFVRSLELPREVQVDKAKANFKNGVLEIRLPKTEEAKRKETKIRIE